MIVLEFPQRPAPADLVLDVALKEAAQLLVRPEFTPAYNLARAELVVQRAAESAGRLLGDHRRAGL